MAVLAISALGAVGAGSLASAGIIGSTFLGVSAASWGWMIGGIVGSMLFGPEGTDHHGPRLRDSTYTGQVEGTDMPILWGGDRLPGKPIWIKNPPRLEVKKEESGGKGGAPSQTYYTYTYYQDFAISFGEFLSEKPRRVWLNQEIIYDASGANQETNSGISFSWYTGDTGEIDSLIEQDVGIGNNPSYKGRCLMVIENLELTSKFGNRIPVVEAELQTTGSQGSSLTSYNQGKSVSAVHEYYGLDWLIRHPTDNKFVCNPLLNGYSSMELYLVDMASQYITRFWAGGGYGQQGYFFKSDPYEYNPNAIDSVVISMWPGPGGPSWAVMHEIDYPSGKYIRTTGFSWGPGGAHLGPECQWYFPISNRDASAIFGFLDKFTLLPSRGGGHNVNDLLVPADSGFYGSSFIHFITCIDWVNCLFGTAAAKGGVSKYYYYVVDYNFLGSQPIITRKEAIFDYFYTDLTENDKFYIPGGGGGAQAAGIYISEYNEIWYPYRTSGTPPNGEYMGMMVLDADDGTVKWHVDFVQAGYTTGSSYWGILSGYPHCHFDPNERRIWWSLSGTGDVGNIQVDTKHVAWYPGLSAGNAWACSYPNRNSIWGATEIADDFIVRERKLSIVGQGTIPISTIVADICERSGLTSAEYDVSELTGYSVGSFIHATRHNGRSDIEALLGIPLADGVQSNNKLKFRVRGGSIITTIPEDDLAAQEVQGQIAPVEPIEITIPLELEVPKVYELQYRSSNNVYSEGIARSFIGSGSNIASQTAQLPMALSDQQAADIVERYHQQMLNLRVFKFNLPIKYAYLEPTDVIEVPKGGKNYRVRLTKVAKGANWLLNCEGIVDRSESYASSAVAPGVDEFLGTIQTQLVPIQLILDGPLLRDSDYDHPGPYLTSFVYGDIYPNSTWHYSVDDSVFTALQGQTTQPLVGKVIWGHNPEEWEDWDDSTTLTVEVFTGDTLSSTTKSAILADPTINAFAWGEQGRWEYFNAATCVLVQTTPSVRYELSNLLRGRRGTDNYRQLHGNGEIIVRLDTNSFYRQTLQNSQIGNTFFYRLPRANQAVSDVLSESLTAEAKTLKPYSPIQINPVAHTPTTWQPATAYVPGDEVKATLYDGRAYVCTIGGTSNDTEGEPVWNTTIDGFTNEADGVQWQTHDINDIYTTWTRRTRRGGSLGGDNGVTDGVGGPLEEESELYDLDIVNINSGVVVDTISDIPTPTYDYLGADQVTAGTDKLGHFYMDVYQKSAVVGRGYRGRAYADKGNGIIMNALLDLKPTRLMPLNDAANVNALEFITQSYPGTYTSASNANALAVDNIPSMVANNAAYMKASNTLSLGIGGATRATVIVFGSGPGVTASGLHESVVDITQGGATRRCRISQYNSGQFYGYWAPRANTGGINFSFDTTTEKCHGAMWMAAITIDLVGTYRLRGYVNAEKERELTYGTAHSTYASTLQGQTRNAAYNDTLGAEIAPTITGLKQTGSIGTVAVFNKLLSDTEIANIYYTVINKYNDHVDRLSGLNTHMKIDTNFSSYTWESARKGYGFNNKNNQGLKRCLTVGNRWSALTNATTGRFWHRPLPDAWRIQEFTTEIWIKLDLAVTASFHYILSFEPLDYESSTAGYRGFQLIGTSTVGLLAWFGDGTTTPVQVHAGVPNLVLGTTHHCAVSIHPTNGIKLYLDGVEIANNSGVGVTIEWNDGAGLSGPTEPTAYINTKNNTNATPENATGLGIDAYYNEFRFYTRELTAAEILENYNRALGVVV